MSKDVQEMLQEAVEGTPESSTGAEEKVEAKVTDDGTVPRSRLNEVSQKLKDSTSAWEAEKAQMGQSLAEAQTKVAELADALAKGRSHTELVSALETLARDPKHSDLIERVNLALAGKDYDAEEDQREDDQDREVDPKATSKALKAELRSEMENALSEQRQEVILQQADLIAKDYMRQLPNEKYSDADKEIIAELWANKVDWDKIEQEPAKLGDLLQDSLQVTLDKWEAAHPTQDASEETDENKQDSEKAPTVEEEIGQILGKNWGSVQTDKDGKSTPEVSEEEFNKGFGELFKKLNTVNS